MARQNLYGSLAWHLLISMGRRARRRRGATRAMSILYLLLPLSLAFVLAIGVALWWAVFSGQYDDTEDQGAAILRDNDN
ncbi:outer membrane protein [Bordetella pertussis]|nr:outer membrane protein [Bordetella pertussis]